MKEYLDIREINGYSIQYAPFKAADQSRAPIECLVFIGLPNNPQFVGVQEPQKLAEHILQSQGPSGDNREYLFMLEKALTELGPHSGDRHVEDLANRVRKLEGELGPKATNAAIQDEVYRVKSGQGHGELEEMENPQ